MRSPTLGATLLLRGVGFAADDRLEALFVFRGGGGALAIGDVLRCKKGFFKIMMFTSPQGDFHFYKQHGVCEYKIQPGNTIKGVAAFFKVPQGRIIAAARKAGGFKAGKRIVFKVNLCGQCPNDCSTKSLTREL